MATGHDGGNRTGKRKNRQALPFFYSYPGQNPQTARVRTRRQRFRHVLARFVPCWFLTIRRTRRGRVFLRLPARAGSLPGHHGRDFFADNLGGGGGSHTLHIFPEARGMIGSLVLRGHGFNHSIDDGVHAG